ncbi:MAG: rubrerythrin family protein [Chthoniobacterales bacterium]
MKTKSMSKTFFVAILGLTMTCALAQETAKPAASQSMRNLQAAYLGEAQASGFYLESARQAQRDGYPDVAKLFRAASLSEAIHRDNHRRAIRFLGATPQRIPAGQPKIKSTRDNLTESVADERHESRVMYPDYIRTARRERSPSAERTFRFARETERAHAKLFQRALDNLGGKPATDYFVCQTCGMTTMDSVPAVCSVCRSSGLDYRKVE